MAVKRCRTSIWGLPEDCLAKVFALTTPKDACRFSAVASTFRSAADSDAVWERFLPSDHLDVISRSIDGPDSLLSQVHSKKDLYLRLSDHPILVDSGLKTNVVERNATCWLQEPSISFGAIHLNIGNLTQDPGSQKWHNFGMFVGWINTKLLSFGTNYAAYLVFMFKIKSKTHGFDHLSAEACVGIKGLEMDKRSVFLDPDRERMRERLERQQNGAETEENNGLLKRRADRWMEVELGECFVTGGDANIEMCLLEGKRLNWKRGLIIQGIEIRPKECT